MPLSRERQRIKSYIAHREPFAVNKCNWLYRDGQPPLCAIHNEAAKWHRNRARESGGQWICPTCSREKSKGQRRSWKTAHTDPFIYNLKRAFTAAKHHSKVVGRAFSISFADVLEMWSQQRGRCAITDLEMQWLPGNGVRNQFKVTMDRKDSTSGYVDGNVWLVCEWVNRAKTDMTKEQAVLFACGILRVFADTRKG